MGRMIFVPRAALERLLKESGSTLTPEQFVAAQPEARSGDRYAGRIRAAAWSKNILMIVTVLSAIFSVLSFDLEDMTISVMLAVVTYYEYRVHRYFIDGDARAPMLGLVNQSCFAAGILIYGLAHAAFSTPMQIPTEYRSLIDADSQALIVTMTRVTYLIVGIVGGISQFGLAWYYRNAQTLL